MPTVVRFFTFSLVLFFLSPAAYSQLRVGPVMDNPILKKAALETRDYPIDKHIFLIPGSSQTVCLYLPFPGFDSLKVDSLCSVPLNTTWTIDSRCVTFTAADDATIGQEKLCFNYFRADTLPYKITVLIDIVNPLKLPFFEDFSTSQVYPDQKKWTDNNVFINNTMAWHPPSVGVATFDGLNSNGTPYGGTFGRSDVLTSQYFDLTGTGTVYLSFYAQPKGNMYYHEERDSLVLELRKPDGEWVSAVQLPGIDNSKPSSYIPDFELHYLVLDDIYKYKGFQFRFVNYGYKLGVYSTWHLDYIRMEVNRSPLDGINDIAFTEPPGKFFSQYTHIPYSQFKGHEKELVSDSTSINVWNHYTTKENTESSNIKISEISSGITLLDNKVLLEDPQTQRDLTPGLHSFINTFDPGQLSDDIKSLVYNQQLLIIRQEYSILDVQDEQKSNNTVIRDSEIGKVLAYDDGTAEMHVTTPAYSSLKTQVALKFHLNTPDTLRGVQFHFPRIYSDVSNQLFNLKVWVGTLDKDPDYVYELRRPVYPDTYFDTLQGFTSYPLVDAATQAKTPLYIPAGDFYIGWQQVSVSATDQYIPVGIDRNFTGGEDLMYFNGDNKNWVTFRSIGDPELRGVAMIRAVFDDVRQTSKNHKNLVPISANIYPNPCNSSFRLESNADLSEHARLKVYNTLGQLMYSGEVNKQVDTEHWSPGLYTAIIEQDGIIRWQEKLIRIR